MSKAIEISVIGEASITRNKVLVDYSELKKLTESHERLLDALRELVYAANNPHSTWETVREEVDKSIKVLDVIKAAQE